MSDSVDERTSGAAEASSHPMVDSLSIVVPVYNSQNSLPLLVERLAQVLPELAQRWELVLVNDASPDDSWGVIRKLADAHDWVRGINLMRNYGQQNATVCGIRAARGSVVVTMDDDLQHPPEEISKLLARLDEGYDVVYGSPEREQHGLGRDLASRITKFVLQKGMGSETARRVSAFRALRRDLCAAFSSYRSEFVSIDVLLTWATSRFSAVTVRHDPREHGVSNYSVGKLVTHALNMFTGFSVFPLQIASLTGFAFTLFGVGVLAWVLGRYLITGDSVPGFPFLASVIAIFSGAQLFALGIIGEYLARMHFRMMKRPAYTVRDTTSVEETD